MRFQESPVHLRVTSIKNVRKGKHIIEEGVVKKFASAKALNHHIAGKSERYMRESSVEVLVHGVPMTGCTLREYEHVGITRLILEDLTGDAWNTAMNWLLVLK